jgi:hypothetical protein
MVVTGELESACTRRRPDSEQMNTRSHDVASVGSNILNDMGPFPVSLQAREVFGKTGVKENKDNSCRKSVRRWLVVICVTAARNNKRCFLLPYPYFSIHAHSELEREAGPEGFEHRTCWAT